MAASRTLALAALLAGCGYSGSGGSPGDKSAESAPGWRGLQTFLGLSRGAVEADVVAALGRPTGRTEIRPGLWALQWEVSPAKEGTEASVITAVMGAEGLEAIGVTGRPAVKAVRDRGHTDRELDVMGLEVADALTRLPGEATVGQRVTRLTSPAGEPPVQVDLRADVGGKVAHIGVSWGAPD